MSSTSQRRKSTSSAVTSTGWKKSPKTLGILVDRCLTPGLARTLAQIDQVKVATLSEMYGAPEAQQLPDEVFLADAGRAGWIVVTKNPDMWQVPHERTAIEQHGTRVFCLANAQATRETQGYAYGRWFLTIKRRALDKSPCFWRIHPNGTYHDCA